MNRQIIILAWTSQHFQDRDIKKLWKDPVLVICCSMEWVLKVVVVVVELREKRKTINGDDLLWVMATLGFEDYIDPLKVYLNRYIEGDTKGTTKGADGSDCSPGITFIRRLYELLLIYLYVVRKEMRAYACYWCGKHDSLYSCNHQFHDRGRSILTLYGKLTFLLMMSLSIAWYVFLMLFSITTLITTGLSVGRTKLLSSFGYSSWGLSAILPAVPVTVLTLGFHLRLCRGVDVGQKQI
ncbi:hypothetical protein C5167_030972 [Papaver somniferum]|nr:hypothetical protein C5167_030972 [Papaver somniferum]